MKLRLPKQSWLSQIFTLPIKRGVGVKNSSCVLSEEQVLEIRRLYREGLSTYKIAERFKMSQPAVHHIISRYTWKHLD